MNQYTRTLRSMVNPPQSEPIFGREKEMAQNDAGGYVFTISPMEQFKRFLVLGSESGTYYASSSKLTKDNTKNIITLFNSSDGREAVSVLEEMSTQGRVPKVSPVLYTLALALSSTNKDTRVEASRVFNAVVRTQSHLFEFVNYVNELRGWGRLLKESVANWYESKPLDKLAYQMVKYRNRNDWSTADVLRMAHPKPTTKQRSALYAWAVGKGYSTKLPEIVHAFELLKAHPSKVELINGHGLTHEMVPTELLNDPKVWERLLETMPATAMLRNLGKMTSIGLIAPLSDAAKHVRDVLSNSEWLSKSRVHPYTILMALTTYRAGRGVKGKLTWSPNAQIVDALETAFYAAFKNIEPSNKNTLLALDVSGSMGQLIMNTHISAAMGATAMAMVTARSEPNYAVMGFADTFRDLGITKIDSLETAMRKAHDRNFSSTDCAKPITWAQTNKVPVENFVVYTDNETWAGSIHPSTALKNYRQATGINAMLTVVGMTATNFSIADPKDPRMMDVVGFDAAAPQVIADFARE